MYSVRMEIWGFSIWARCSSIPDMSHSYGVDITHRIKAY